MDRESLPLYKLFHLHNYYNINQNMTTAHRPTWNSARGSEQGGNNLVVPKRSYSALDMPAQLKLKERREG
jgi:hypothetical protein